MVDRVFGKRVQKERWVCRRSEKGEEVIKSILLITVGETEIKRRNVSNRTSRLFSNPQSENLTIVFYNFLLNTKEQCFLKNKKLKGQCLFSDF